MRSVHFSFTAQTGLSDKVEISRRVILYPAIPHGCPLAHPPHRSRQPAMVHSHTYIFVLFRAFQKIESSHARRHQRLGCSHGQSPRVPPQCAMVSGCDCAANHPPRKRKPRPPRLGSSQRHGTRQTPTARSSKSRQLPAGVLGWRQIAKLPWIEWKSGLSILLRHCGTACVRADVKIVIMISEVANDSVRCSCTVEAHNWGPILV